VFTAWYALRPYMKQKLLVFIKVYRIRNTKVVRYEIQQVGEIFPWF